MNKCEQFLDNKDKFQWFIVEYFGVSIYFDCVDYAQSGDEVTLMNMLNLIWFRLPDHLFNIRTNPSGWSEFLSLLED